MSVWLILLILFLVALAFSAIGFKKFVWFLSIGYGLSVCACGLATIIIFAILQKLTLLGLIACVVLMCYGFRLGGFLAIREFKNANYRKTLQEATKTEKPMPIFVKVTIWLCVGLLYAAQVSGVVFVLNAREAGVSFLEFNWFEIVGVVVMILGAVIEAVADFQKSKYKKLDPKKPAMKGLYKIQRCPNYYGEILFWTGVVVYFFATVVPYNAKWYMFVIVFLAWLSISYVMLNGAKRLEKRQARNYGEMEEFKEYTKKTPIIFFVIFPIKSLLNSKVIK